MLAYVSIVPVAVTGDTVVGLLGMLIGGAGLLIVVSVVAGRRGLLPRALVPFGRWVAVVVACLSLGAAAIHFAVIGDHFAPSGRAVPIGRWGGLRGSNP